MRFNLSISKKKHCNFFKVKEEMQKEGILLGNDNEVFYYIIDILANDDYLLDEVILSIKDNIRWTMLKMMILPKIAEIKSLYFKKK